MRSHADVFADALDGTTTEQLDDTGALLAVVGRLRALPGSDELAGGAARLDFRAELRARLVAEASATPATAEGSAKVVPIASRWNQSWQRRNRARILTGVAAGVVAVTVVSVAASNSLPGSPFYPLKRGGEAVEYGLAGSDDARGKLELSFARTRLSEIDRLTAHNAAYGIAPVDGDQAAGGTTVLATSTSTRVVGLFADMNTDAAKGSTLLARSFAGDPRPGPMLAVEAFAKFQQAALTVLTGRLAQPALAQANQSLAWTKQVVKQSAAVLAVCTSTSCPAASVAELKGPLDPRLQPGQQSPLPPSAAPSVLATTAAPSSAAPASVLPSLTPSVPPSASAPAPTSLPVPSTSAVPPTSPVPPTQPILPPPASTPVTTPPSTTTPAPPQPSATQSSTAAPTSTSTAPPTSTTPPQPSSAPPQSTAPPTTPEPTSAAPTTPPPPPPPTTPAPTTPPATTPAPTTPPPATTPAPTTAAPTTTPPTTVPPTTMPPTTMPPTTTPPRTGRPPLICLPPAILINGICVRGSAPPGVG